MKNILILLFSVFLFSCSSDEGIEVDTDTDNDFEIDTVGFRVTSEAIVNGELLANFKCESKTNDIENSIPLAWLEVPEGTGSLAVTMIHYPNADDLTNPNSYLLLWDIDPSTTEIPYGTADDGPWYMGQNKDGTAISYTSPCSPSAATHEYTITVYALSETPASLPMMSSIDVDYSTLIDAIGTVTTIETTKLTFNDVTE
ncbi:MAG: YbhB/YbcL family Raf kinase inhibitor-like protein [Cyclobacteriaceae bacterium]